MKRTTAFSISKATLEKLRGKTQEEHALHRLHCVVLVLGGISPKDVSLIYGDSPRAIAYWVKKFEAGGESNLLEKERSGRPSQLDPLQMEKVREFVDAQRQNKKRVNGKALAEYIKASFNINVTERHCWRLLKEIVKS